MNKPFLQIALDTENLEEALAVLANVHTAIDIIEIGTTLLMAAGVEAVTTIKKLYPTKTVLADGKIADAGTILGNILFRHGADIVTVICCADPKTIQAVQAEAVKYNGDVQIELTGTWNLEQAKIWSQLGIKQVVYHRPRDAELSGQEWGEKDFHLIQSLIDLGFKVTATGGINLKNLHLFKAFPLYIIISGRQIVKANNQLAAAKQLQSEMASLWN